LLTVLSLILFNLLQCQYWAGPKRLHHLFPAVWRNSLPTAISIISLAIGAGNLKNASVAQNSHPNEPTDLRKSVTVLVLSLIGPLVASAGVALLCKWLHLDGRPASFWILVSPLVYFVWLIFLLSFYALETSLLGLFYCKPRRFDSRQSHGHLAFDITLLLYGHAFLLQHLPMLQILGRGKFFLWLIFRAYSPKAPIGHNVVSGGEVSDPDITFIGPGVVMGDACHFIAHVINRSSTGSILYQSAPIELQDNCTIGGGTRIELGVIVGAGSLVEPHSRVQAFTHIPPGEVWGGIPATFRRKREATPEIFDSIPISPATPTRPVSAEKAKLHKLIAEALEVPLEQISSESSARNCLAWDSIGRMAIAAALHDRFGLDLPPEMIDRLDAVADVEKAVVSRRESKPHATAISLPANPELLPLLDPAQVLAQLADQMDSAPALLKPIRVVIAATFIVSPLAPALRTYCRAFGLEPEVEFFDFNQVPQALLSPDSPMRQNRKGLNVVLIRPEDWPGKNSDGRKVVAGQFLDAVRNFAATSGCALLVSDLPPAISFPLERRAETSELQSGWRHQLQAIGGLEVMPFADIIEELGTVAARPSPAEGDIVLPFSPVVYQRLGIGIARTLRKLARAPKKVLALDADNTLWGGIVGEDGIGGLQLADDAAGRGYRAFQSAILALKQRGILLVLVSKNLAADLWNVVENHPRMILRRNDFAAARINWQPKSENLRALAEELNLGLDAFVFLDDNPAERLEVELNSSSVTVVPLPANADQYAETLSRLWCFDGAGETLEDEKRNQFTQQEIQRKEFQAQSAGGLDAYLRALELKVIVHPAREEDLPRVSQLLQKTNQFNLSLKRRTLPETRALRPAHEIWVVSVSDRFGDYGMVGVCIARPENGSLFLDSFLMSCRALGRGAETAFLHSIASKARSMGVKSLLGELVTGPRNQPMEQFLQKSGFTKNGGGLCELDLDHAPAAPAHLCLEVQ
jgi:FkbH-like protein